MSTRVPGLPRPGRWRCCESASRSEAVLLLLCPSLTSGKHNRCAVVVRCCTPVTIRQCGHRGGLKGHDKPAQGKRAGWPPAGPSVALGQPHQDTPEPCKGETDSRMFHVRRPFPGLSRPVGALGDLWGHLPQGDAPRGLGACPGLACAAPLGLKAPNHSVEPTSARHGAMIAVMTARWRLWLTSGGRGTPLWARGPRRRLGKREAVRPQCVSSSPACTEFRRWSYSLFEICSE